MAIHINAKIIIVWIANNLKIRYKRMISPIIVIIKITSINLHNLSNQNTRIMINFL